MSLASLHIKTNDEYPITIIPDEIDYLAHVDEKNCKALKDLHTIFENLPETKLIHKKLSSLLIPRL